MPDLTPYELLGVGPDASADDLRRAYRRRLRETHPDTGGSADEFDAVQRAWDRVGSADARAEWDRIAGIRSAPTGSSRVPFDGVPRSGAFTGAEGSVPEPPRARRDAAPSTRSHGHPGGWRRERYLALVREWVGRGVELADPYDAGLVARVPRDIRHVLDDALAEETTARTLAPLGLEFSVWHDVATGRPGEGEQKIDHVVLGPGGLFAVLSEDWGSPVTARRNELVGEGIPSAERPFAELANRAKVVAKSARVDFTALVIVVPDVATDAPVTDFGRHRRVPALLVQASALAGLVRSGPDGARRISADELFATRESLQRVIRFV